MFGDVSGKGVWGEFGGNTVGIGLAPHLMGLAPKASLGKVVAKDVTDSGIGPQVVTADEVLAKDDELSHGSESPDVAEEVAISGSIAGPYDSLVNCEKEMDSGGASLKFARKIPH